MSACRHNHGHDQGATECVSGTCQFAAKVTDTLTQTKGEYLFNLTALHAYAFPCYSHLQPAVAMRLISVGMLYGQARADGGVVVGGLCDVHDRSLRQALPRRSGQRVQVLVGVCV
jgi:hypothetical protein